MYSQVTYLSLDKNCQSLRFKRLNWSFNFLKKSIFLFTYLCSNYDMKCFSSIYLFVCNQSNSFLPFNNLFSSKVSEKSQTHIIIHIRYQCTRYSFILTRSAVSNKSTRTSGRQISLPFIQYQLVFVPIVLRVFLVDWYEKSWSNKSGKCFKKYCRSIQSKQDVRKNIAKIFLHYL